MTCCFLDGCQSTINDQRPDSSSNENFSISIDKGVFYIINGKHNHFTGISMKWDKSVATSKFPRKSPQDWYSMTTWARSKMRVLLCVQMHVTGEEDWFFRHIYGIERIQWHELNMRSIAKDGKNSSFFLTRKKRRFQQHWNSNCMQYSKQYMFLFTYAFIAQSFDIHAMLMCVYF